MALFKSALLSRSLISAAEVKTKTLLPAVEVGLVNTNVQELSPSTEPSITKKRVEADQISGSANIINRKPPPVVIGIVSDVVGANIVDDDFEDFPDASEEAPLGETVVEGKRPFPFLALGIVLGGLYLLTRS